MKTLEFRIFLFVFGSLKKAMHGRTPNRCEKFENPKTNAKNRKYRVYYLHYVLYNEYRNWQYG